MRRALSLAAVLCISSLPGRAATITQSATIPIQGTNWSESLAFTKFDPALGTLDSVSFSLTGSVTARIGFENFRSNPSTVTSRAAATITVHDPVSGVVLIQVLPGNTITDVLTGFDLGFNYAGSSGRNYGYQPGDLIFLTVGQDLGVRTASAMNSAAHGPLDSFVGTGNVLVPVTAVNLTTVTGTGGLVNSTFDTDAAAGLTITYDYTAGAASVPELGTSLLTGTAFVMLGMVSSPWGRRRSRPRH